MSEVGYGLHAANRLGYIDALTLAELEIKICLVAAPLRGLMERYRLRSALVRGAGAVLAAAVLTNWLSW